MYNIVGSDFDPRLVFGCFGPLWDGTSKFFFHQNVPWTIPGQCLFYNFLLPCTQRAPKIRKGKNSQITSNQVKSYNVPAQHYGGHKIFNFTPRDIRTGRAIEITNKMNIPQIYQLTNINSTKNQCS